MLVLGSAGMANAGDFHDWARTPPMGWNSWDFFATAITEREAKEQADAMEKYLLPAGYDVFTVDIQWYHRPVTMSLPSISSGTSRPPKPIITMRMPSMT